MGDECKIMRPRPPRVGDKRGRQVGDKCKSMRPRAPRVEEKQLGRQVWRQVGDKRGRQLGDKCKIMRPRPPRVGDKCETSVKSCGPEHPEWNASPETKAKSCGPGMQPFERSKNPIQVNLFGEKRAHRHKEVEMSCRTASKLVEVSTSTDNTP